MTCQYKFSHIPGFFIDYVDAAKKCPGAKITTQPQLGILERAYEPLDTSPTTPKDSPQWAQFAKHVQDLNKRSSNGESYKLLYIIRHGFGVHNMVMEKVGSEAWKSHWSHLDGGFDVTWDDARLVEAGVAQAQENAQLWIDGARDDEMPLPETIYTSPLARCLETTKLVYAPVMSQHGRSLQPMIKESLREFITDHTCDRRSSRSWITQNYPEYIIEEDLSEKDGLWKADSSETHEAHVVRKQKLLEEIFASDPAPFISLTTHSYAVSAILEVVGAPKFRVGEGAMIPLFVKAEKIAPETTG
ncbi:histidine phosphatase superfamily [Xylariales sp. AK1849]|nr:histidine phosphatase superfamily [Xylariales sp. AK1849]